MNWVPRMACVSASSLFRPLFCVLSRDIHESSQIPAPPSACGSNPRSSAAPWLNAVIILWGLISGSAACACESIPVYVPIRKKAFPKDSTFSNPKDGIGSSHTLPIQQAMSFRRAFAISEAINHHNSLVVMVFRTKSNILPALPLTSPQGLACHQRVLDWHQESIFAFQRIQL